MKTFSINNMLINGIIIAGISIIWVLVISIRAKQDIMGKVASSRIAFTNALLYSV